MIRIIARRAEWGEHNVELSMVNFELVGAWLTFGKINAMKLPSILLSSLAVGITALTSSCNEQRRSELSHGPQKRITLFDSVPPPQDPDSIPQPDTLKSKKPWTCFTCGMG
jgi:hypothetical protein